MLQAPFFAAPECDAPDGGRIRVLMLCAHEPTLDPRVRWEAESAAGGFETTVLGFNREDGSKPALENVSGYRIIRVMRRDFGLSQFFFRLKEVLSWPALFAWGVVLLLLSPFVILGELLLRVSRPGLRFALRAMRSVRRRLGFQPSANPMAESLRLRALRSQPVARLLYILAVLRVQFAPAAVLLWNQILSMGQKPHVVHCNDLDTLLVGVLAKQRFGSRVIYDAHEFYPVADPHGMWVDVKFFTMVERLLIAHADAVVTVNPMLAELMRATYGLTHVSAVANAEPWVEHRPSLSPSPMGSLARGRLKFLFQGRFTPERGIDEIIKAWANVDGDRAALFLRGPHNMWRDASIDLARGLGVLDRSVYFLDAVTEDELVAMAAEADVGIVPYKPLVVNDRFSCPNKLSQYLHAGLMVVTNDLPYVRSVVEEAQAGLAYTSSDLTTLVKAVHRVVDEPELLRTCRSNALKYAQHTFNWQRQGSLLLSLYSGSHREGSPSVAQLGVPVSSDHPTALSVARASVQAE